MKNRAAFLLIIGGAFLAVDKILRDFAMIETGQGAFVDRGLSALRDALTPDGKADAYIPAINSAEARHGIPTGMLFRVLYKESRFRPDIISGATRSPVGALGIAQFMPATAADLHVDPLDPFAAIDAAARYLKALRGMAGTWRGAVAAYNWGIGNVQRKGLDRMPAETRDYVAFIYDQGGFNA